MAKSFGERSVEVHVGHERVALGGDGRALAIADHAAESRPALVTSHRELLKLIDGETTLLDALEENRVRLRGSPGELITFHDALMAYLHGCVRTPDMPARLARYRDEVERLERV